jgi:membrane fusion protein (multidrug efflux system)
MFSKYLAVTSHTLRSTPSPLVVFTLAFTLVACSPADSDSAAPSSLGAGPPPPSVTVAPVITRQVADIGNYVGRTTAVQRVELVARVPGVLEKRDFVEGSEVTAGQLLFEIDPRQYDANRAVTAAALANAEAAHTKALKYRNRLNSVTAGGVSATAIEEAENNLLQAAAQRAQAKAQLQLSELELSYAKITAPISGRIGTASVDVGNLVGTNAGVLATIVQLDPVRVTFGVSERVSTRFMQARLEQGLGRPDMEFFTPRIVLSDGEEYPHVGKLDFIATEISPTTSTLEIRAVFPNPEGLIRPGQFVNISVQRGAKQERPVVPQSSVQQDQAGYYVLVVDGEGTVGQRRVTLGERLGIDWVVESGLEPGEQVIFAGIQKVRPGAKVTINVADPRSGLEG